MPDGQRVQRTTREVDRKKAQKAAETFEEATRNKRTARASQRVIAEIYQRATGDRLPSATARSYFTSWLARKKPETAASTFAFYQGKALGFLAFLDSKADDELARLSTADVLTFRKAESERVAAPTVNHGIKFLRMVFEQARRDGLIFENPAADVAVVKKRTQAERRPFTLPEIHRLLAAADAEWRSLILFGFYTGQRLGDLSRLTWTNVDLEQDELRLVTGKTKRRQIIPLAPPLLRHLANLPAGDNPKQPLHPRAFEVVAREGKTGTLSRQFYELMAQTGMVAPKSHKRAAGAGSGVGRTGRRQSSEISFHALRHTATSLLKNAGVSSAVVQEFIGHESEAINRVYTHIETETMRQAADKLPDVLALAKQPNEKGSKR